MSLIMHYDFVDSEISPQQFEQLSASPDLNHLVVSLSTNQLFLVNILDYYQVQLHKHACHIANCNSICTQIFPYHYHPDFAVKQTKNQGSKTTPSSSHFDISKEEEEERGKYGGLAPHQHKEKFQGLFPGSYAWQSRVEQLAMSVHNFAPDKMRYLNFCQSSSLPGSTQNEGKENGPLLSVACHLKKAWYEEPQSTTVGNHNAFSAKFVTGTPTELRQSQEPSQCSYDSHCLLPAASQEDLKLIRVGFMCDVIVAYYGDSGGTLPTDQTPAVGTATYCVESKCFSYIR